MGGVVLASENENFLGFPETIPDTYGLVTGLQEIEWNNSLDIPPGDQTNGPLNSHTYIPLFIGLEQPGDGLPYDQILNGLSPVAPEMAIGATWDPESAMQTGSILGSELSSLGFNLYFGPSLDVLTSPSPSKQGDPGTLVFGGDPFWVGKLGQAYIAGLHEGSNESHCSDFPEFPRAGRS